MAFDFKLFIEDLAQACTSRIGSDPTGWDKASTSDADHAQFMSVNNETELPEWHIQDVDFSPETLQMRRNLSSNSI